MEGVEEESMKNKRKKIQGLVFRTERLVVAARWEDVCGACSDFLWFNKGK